MIDTMQYIYVIIVALINYELNIFVGIIFLFNPNFFLHARKRKCRGNNLIIILNNFEELRYIENWLKYWLSASPPRSTSISIILQKDQTLA